MKNPSKFVVITRGRTGSTAIIDELNNHKDITCFQELFISLESRPSICECYKKFGLDFEKYGLVGWMPTYDPWIKLFKEINLALIKLYRKDFRIYTRARVLEKYFHEMEDMSIAQGSSAVGFKLLEHQYPSIRTMFNVLKKAGYKIIYLERTNVIRQVLSGVIANKRKIYNARSFVPEDEAFEIDMDEFEKLVNYEIKMVNSQKKMIEKSGVDSLFVAYEGFLEDRERFLKVIFDFVGVESIVPEETNFSIMIPDVKKVVSNYDEFSDRVKKMGFEAPL